MPSLPSPFPSPKHEDSNGTCRDWCPKAKKPRHQSGHSVVGAGKRTPMQLSKQLSKHSPGKLRSAALLARGVDWISSKTEKLFQPNRVSPLVTEEAEAPSILQKPSGATEAEMLELRHALNLPEEVMSQAHELFQRHTKPVASGSFMDRRLTKPGFEDVWCEMTGQEDEAESCVPPKILAEAFRHANGSRSLDFEQFATWFSSRCFCEDVSLDKESKQLRRIARKHAMHHSEVEKYKHIFSKFDQDGSGTIDSKEFEELLCTCIKAPSNIGLPAARVKNLWRIADEDGDHEINFEEFLEFYSKYLRTDSTGFEDFYRFGGSLSRQSTSTLSTNESKKA